MGKKLVTMLGEQSGRMTAMGLLVTLTVTMAFSGWMLSSSAEASTLSTVKDTITNATPSALTDHVITFTTINAIPDGASLSITFDAAFGMGSVGTGDVACAACMSANEKVVGQVVTFGNNTGTPWAAGAFSVTIGGTNKVSNPVAVGSEMIAISTFNGAGTIDSGSTWVAINDAVVLTADVTSYFDFVVEAANSGTAGDGTTSTIPTDVNACNFGTLEVGMPEICAQELNARTNALGGYVVTVEQNHDMLASSGADIDAFANGTPSAGATWTAPTGVNGSADTYGHMGLYSTDNAAAGIASDSFFGLNGTTQKVVLSHSVPTTGSAYTGWGGTDVDGQNHAVMLYQVEISDLQEPGHYANRLMYIGTATF